MMKAYRVEKQIAANGELKLSGLPFKEGDKVEVIILSHENRLPSWDAIAVARQGH